MSIASEITRLQGVKSDILQAISDKGVDVPVGAALGDCPDLIASISGGLQIKESILNMADDWEDVSDQFELINNYILKELNQTIITVENAGIMYSKKLSVVFFSKQIYLCSPNSIGNDNSWHGGLSLKQNSRFYDNRDTSITDVYKMKPTNYVFPTDINRGTSIAQMFHLDSPNVTTTNWYGVIGYTGPGDPNGISIKVILQGSGVSPKAFELTGLVFYVTERQ